METIGRFPGGACSSLIKLPTYKAAPLQRYRNTQNVFR
jgi:hypothetical protein